MTPRRKLAPLHDLLRCSCQVDRDRALRQRISAGALGDFHPGLGGGGAAPGRRCPKQFGAEEILALRESASTGPAD